MTARPQQQPSVCHYFVDEAGDPTLFSRRGRVIASDPTIQVLPRTPAQSAGLQAADYLL